MADFVDFVATRPAAEETQAEILHYTQQLCEVLEQDFQSSYRKSNPYTFTIETARKYHKVIETNGGGRRSIHAFIDCKTGDVFKPASFKAPAKGVRFNLLDPISRQKCLTKADWAGGYLYVR